MWHNEGVNQTSTRYPSARSWRRIARRLERELQATTAQLHELHRIGMALSAERDIQKLLRLILQKSREITSADAGSLYLIEASEGDGHSLRFCLAQNDSLRVPFEERRMELSPLSLAGYAAMTGQPLRIEDAYHLPPDAPYHLNHVFDAMTGYHTKSVLVVPMRNLRGEVIGVIQLINRKRHARTLLRDAATVEREVIPFDARCAELMKSLASQAAIALENSLLYRNIENLFESFVHASVYAIESRDPCTRGHSERVATLTVALAEAVNETRQGSYRDVFFSREQLKEIRYAALLHDFGKIGVREEVLTKPKKRSADRMAALLSRFDMARRTLEKECAERKLHYLLQYGSEGCQRVFEAMDAELSRELRTLENFRQAVIRANEPNVISEGDFRLLRQIATYAYRNVNDASCPLLDADDVITLSIPRGSLTPEEWQEMRDHVRHTYEFLLQIQWTKDLQHIPTIARAHHEKLDGSGYPDGRTANDIPLQAKMMTICDIYDTLTAADRPYKKSLSPERALRILQDEEAAQGKLDAELVDIFVKQGIYRVNEL
jgi:HD-GYP domain-containing protein (c-di-GMP phosphodiesterase class II)